MSLTTPLIGYNATWQSGFAGGAIAYNSDVQPLDGHTLAGPRLTSGAYSNRPDHPLSLGWCLVNSKKVTEGVRVCVHHCLGFANPMTAIDGQIQLMAHNGWNEGELEEIERLSRQMLSILCDPPGNS